MRPHLLFPDRDFDPRTAHPWAWSDLERDLDLETVFGAMAQGDTFTLDIVRRVVLSGPGEDAATIHHRQEILRDVLKTPAFIRSLQSIVADAVAADGRHYLGTLTQYPSQVLRWSSELIPDLLIQARRLRALADDATGTLSAPGWQAFLAMLRSELDDAFFLRAESVLQEVRRDRGLLLSATLGPGLKGRSLTLHRPPEPPRGWRVWLFPPKPGKHGFTINARDQAGTSMLSELRDRGTAIAAAALGHTADHVRGFFHALRHELAFYLGCLALHERLAAIGAPTCVPETADPGARVLAGRGVYDLSLALRRGAAVVGNDFDAGGKGILVVTGANQGGKTTFLRSLGLAQLMTQCGMFAAAEMFRTGLCDRLFTHFRREEDAAMASGKLDEELARMSAIVDHLGPFSMVLFNESFSATNEREGSEIATQIVSALLERGIRLAFVTHLYEFPHALHERDAGRAAFLRADRARSFRLSAGEPLRTAHAEDLYERVFGGDTKGAPPARGAA